MDRKTANDKMEVARSHIFPKPNQRINSVVRNTSCSRGWLRLVVQLVFGAVTVASFVMILLMALQRPEKPFNQHCRISNCMIICEQSNYDRTYEEEILSAVQETSLTCRKISLTLRNVQFANATMPVNWMHRITTDIDRLTLAGGNLRFIPHSAFVGPFAGKLSTLILEDITIERWSPDTLVGLNMLQSLFITNTVFGNIKANALSAVHETLRALTVTSSGKWDPVFVTGTPSSESLHHVDFSRNNFGDIINDQTFRNLKQCRVLFLNACKITAIGAGAFDHLESLQMLFLNDNYLVTIPPGLFSTIIRIEQPKPRIHLQDNRWQCDCSQTDLMYLYSNDFLLVDPMCYQPKQMHGSQISDLHSHCEATKSDVEVVIIPRNEALHRYEPQINATMQACFGQNDGTFRRIISPISRFHCNMRGLEHSIEQALPHIKGTNYGLDNNNWLKSTFHFQTAKHSVIQLGSLGSDDHGLVWIQSSCPNIIYCINVLPNYLRVHNVVCDEQYIFCPLNLETAEVETDNCVAYDIPLHVTRDVIYLGALPGLYVITAFICLILGALCVYGIIRKNPSLLKGSKRLLFVKHRNVEALVLPPKVPLRNSLTDEDILNNKKEVYTVLDDNKLNANLFNRSNSVRSDKSYSPTYVSAMQPTDAQLAEWRLMNHFDQNSSIISISSDRSMFSWTYESLNKGNTNIAYTSLE